MRVSEEVIQPALRPMRQADVPDVMAIEVRAYSSPWTEGIFRDCLHVGYSCWVLEGDEGLLGYGVMSAGAGEAHLLNLCIAPEAQGQGHGRRLLRHFIEQAMRYHADTVYLEVRPSNCTAIRLYESVGFHQVGLRRGYYPAEKGREDAMVLALEL